MQLLMPASQLREHPAAGLENAREAVVYRNAVETNFRFLKQTRTLDQAQAISLPLPETGGYLMPVCELHSDDTHLISTFSAWRRENMFAFPSQFPVTDAGTSAWLRKRLLDVPDRLLFLVLEKHGRPVGHLGYANCLNDQCAMEIDNVVRGVKGIHAEIMSEAMRTVLKWAEEVIGPHSIFLRVFQDNAHSVAFYRRLGFHDGEVIPLRKQVEGDSIVYAPIRQGDTAVPDKCFLRMEYRPRPQAGGELILTAGPSISGREAWYVLDAVRSGWNQKWSGYIDAFEKGFADYLGVAHALSTSCGTGALHIALLALDIGPGDEVIVPDLTWVATANPIVYAGATPVFADIDPDTWCLDPVSFEAMITPRTRAVIVVHLYGHPAPMDRIMEIARRHHLRVIEDAAPAIGAECHDQKVGTYGDFAAFSFQGAKLLVTGEGGMLVTNDHDLYQKAHDIWDQGRQPGTFWIDKTGYKYKMANIQAALGLAQLERVNELIEAKRRIFRWYAEGLDSVRGIRLNQEAPWARSICWMSSILIDETTPLSRDEVRSELRRRNVDTRPVFPAISQYPIWPVRQPPQSIAKRVGDGGINLPSGVCLKRQQVEYVCRALRETLGETS
jgi:perosamine synthetase